MIPAQADPQLGTWPVYAITLAYVAAIVWLLGWGVYGLVRGCRAWRAARKPPAISLDEHRLSGRFSYLPADQARIEAEIAEYDEAIRIIGQRRQP